jgi:hypothetical protein
MAMVAGDEMVNEGIFEGEGRGLGGGKASEKWGMFDLTLVLLYSRSNSTRSRSIETLLPRSRVLYSPEANISSGIVVIIIIHQLPRNLDPCAAAAPPSRNFTITNSPTDSSTSITHAGLG